jgi:hypothetical protein
MELSREPKKEKLTKKCIISCITAESNPQVVHPEAVTQSTRLAGSQPKVLLRKYI